MLYLLSIFLLSIPVKEMSSLILTPITLSLLLTTRATEEGCGAVLPLASQNGPRVAVQSPTVIPKMYLEDLVPWRASHIKRRVLETENSSPRPLGTAVPPVVTRWVYGGAYYTTISIDVLLYQLFSELPHVCLFCLHHFGVLSVVIVTRQFLPATRHC